MTKRQSGSSESTSPGQGARESMKLGVMWGSGIPEKEIVAWVQSNAASGGWRGRFGTELYDQAQDAGSLAAALRAENMTWSYVMEAGQPAFGVPYWQFLSVCRQAALPIMVCVDPMDPGGLDGDGYHQEALPGTISFPLFDQQKLEHFVDRLLKLIAREFPGLEIAAVQWGNEVEYMPFVADWERAYDRYFRALVGLGSIVAQRLPGVPILVGGSSAAPKIDGDRPSLTWYCGGRAEKEWPKSSAPLGLDFHVELTAETTAEQAAGVASQIEAQVAALRKAFPQRSIFLSECGGYSHFDALGEAAQRSGVAGFWGVAGRWLAPTWGIDKNSQQDTTTLGCFGCPGWSNGPTRDSFERLAAAVGAVER